MKITGKTILIITALTLSLGLGIFSYKLGDRLTSAGPLLQHATYLYDQKVSIPDFELISHDNQTFTQKDIRDKWTFWFFGFTHCPDICPLTLGTLASAINMLEDNSSTRDVNIIFVSVDPARDQPKQLKNYVEAFDSKIIGVTSAQKRLEKFLKKLGVVAVKQTDEKSGTNYLYDHSSSVFLVGPDTGIAALFSTPHTAAGFTQDFLEIKRHYIKNE